jgi:hypothetical protein
MSGDVIEPEKEPGRGSDSAPFLQGRGPVCVGMMLL